LATLNLNNVVPGRQDCEQRYRDRYGTASTGGDSILSIAEGILRANGGEGTMQQIIDAVVARHTVNSDLCTAMRTPCTDKGVKPTDLSDDEVDKIIVREVRRRVCSAINDDNTSGKFRKRPVDPTRRVWNGRKENWYGSR